MTTRSGQSYRLQKVGDRAMSHGEGESAATGGVGDMVKLLLEDRRKREEEYAAERTRRNAEEARRTAEMAKQIELLTRLVGERERPGAVEMAGDRDKVKLTKLGDSDDIEAYLKTFERMMGAYDVPRARWVFKLAPQLSGKAQKAYTALSAEDAVEYDKVKDAILARYDINLETYRRRFREATKGPEETYRQLATRILDSAKQWTRDCTSVGELRELIATEQVLRALPESIRVWVHERKPKTAAEAGQLAEDYLQARRPIQGSKRQGASGQQPETEPEKRCYECRQAGHLAKDCPKRQAGRKSEGTGQRARSEVRCFNCNEKGHVAMRCPAKALFCRGQQQAGEPSVGATGSYSGMEVCRTGLVEGTPVADILLDTGCSRTLVRRDLVPPGKLKEGVVTIRCACGDTINYPLAEVEIMVGGRQICVEAGASETLPTSVLLGVDVPELRGLLSEGYSGRPVLEERVEKAWVVETRAQARLRERREAVEKVKEMTSTAKPTPVVVVPSDGNHEVEGSGATGKDAGFPEYDFDEEVFLGGREQQCLTRRQKRQERLRYRQEKQACGGEGKENPPELTSEGLRKLQQEDPTLEVPRRLAEDGDGSSSGKGFFYRNGLLLRQWMPVVESEEDQVVEQLVLPQACRVTVMKLAHNIPMAG